MEAFQSGEDPVRDYWPGEETFSTEENIFEIPYEVLGSNWEMWLKNILEYINEYLSSREKANIMKSFNGIGAGFVDGDMYLIWSNKNT